MPAPGIEAGTAETRRVVTFEKGMAVPYTRARRRRRAPPHGGFGHVEFGTSAIAVWSPSLGAPTLVADVSGCVSRCEPQALELDLSSHRSVQPERLDSLRMNDGIGHSPAIEADIAVREPHRS